MTSTITRKELAALAGVSVKTVQRHEKDWGLHRFISRTRLRPVEFHLAPVVKHLQQLRVLGRG